MKVLGIIIARGGSKGIPRKNIKHLAGKPLIAYTIEAGLESKLISKLILSTDDKEISKIGKEYGVDVPFLRPESLSKDDTPGLPVITHAVKHMKDEKGYLPDVIIVLQPTSPLRRSNHIDEVLKIFHNRMPDSVISVTKAPHNANPYSIMGIRSNGSIKQFLDYDELGNLRQKKPEYFCRNGAIYACSYKCLVEQNTLYGDFILPYFMEKKDSFDIDDEVDWKIMECLLNGQ
jgi:CMP-N,N'-diacetyllegionaminic acid synthase